MDSVGITLGWLSPEADVPLTTSVTNLSSIVYFMQIKIVEN